MARCALTAALAACLLACAAGAAQQPGCRAAVDALRHCSAGAAGDALQTHCCLPFRFLQEFGCFCEEDAVRDTAALLSGAVVGALQSCRITNPFTAMLSACPAAGAFGAAAEPRRLPHAADPSPARIDVSPLAGAWEDEPAVALFAPAARAAGGAGGAQGSARGFAGMGLSAEARAGRTGAEDGDELALDMGFFDSEALFEDEAALLAEDLQDDLFADLDEILGYVDFKIEDEPDFGWADDKDFAAFGVEFDLEADARDALSQLELAPDLPAEVDLLVAEADDMPEPELDMVLTTDFSDSAAVAGQVQRWLAAASQRVAGGRRAQDLLAGVPQLVAALMQRLSAAVHGAPLDVEISYEVDDDGAPESGDAELDISVDSELMPLLPPGFLAAQVAALAGGPGAHAPQLVAAPDAAAAVCGMATGLSRWLCEHRVHMLWALAAEGAMLACVLAAYVALSRARRADLQLEGLEEPLIAVAAADSDAEELSPLHMYLLKSQRA